MMWQPSKRVSALSRVAATWLWLLIPVAVLGASQVGPASSDVEWRRKLAHSLPKDGRVQMDLVESLVAKGRHIEALEHGEELVRRAPYDETGYRALLSANAASGRRRAALEAFGHLEEMNAANADDLASAGTLLHGVAPIRAVALYREALALDEGHYAANVNLAAALAETGDLVGARAHLMRVHSAHPEDVSILLSLAQLDLRSGNVQSAVARLEVLIAKDPNHHHARKLLSEVRAATHR